MPDLISELTEIETRATAIFSQGNAKAAKQSIESLIEVANEAEAAHSKSWLGYQSLVYYENLRTPPAGAHFDRQWGLQERYSNQTSGMWVQYAYSDIWDHLVKTKTKPSFDQLFKLVEGLAEELDDIREELVLLIEACRAAATGDDYLTRMNEDAKNARMVSTEKYARSNMPPHPPMTNDLTAVAGGTQIPPHAAFRCSVYSIRSFFDSAGELAKIAKRTATYLSKRTEATEMLRKDQQGTRVFIGHGRSAAWLELKNYIQDRLGLQCDDFNREATAGHTTVARLMKMLDDACFAFLILTAEDEQHDKKFHARQNVIHEAGLFQGRLGFERAIVMLESGCEEFSNIHGLGQIRFDTGKISGSFHEVTDTLKREKLTS